MHKFYSKEINNSISQKLQIQSELYFNRNFLYFIDIRFHSPFNLYNKQYQNKLMGKIVSRFCRSEQYDVGKDIFFKDIAMYKHHFWYDSILSIIKSHQFQQTVLEFSEQGLNITKAQMKNLNLQQKSLESIQKMLQNSYLDLEYEDITLSDQLIYVKQSYFAKQKITESEEKILKSKILNSKTISTIETFYQNHKDLITQFIFYNQFTKKIHNKIHQPRSFINILISCFQKQYITSYIAAKNKNKNQPQQLNQKYIVSIRDFIMMIVKLIKFMHDLNPNYHHHKLFREDNLFNLITNELFQDQKIYDIVFQMCQNNSKCQKIKIQQVQFALDQKTLALFPIEYAKFERNSYQSSIKLLQKVMLQKEPIVKLRLLLQLINQIEYTINNFYKFYRIERASILNHRILENILAYLMSQVGYNQICSQIIFINSFLMPKTKSLNRCVFFKSYLTVVGFDKLIKL